MYQTPLASCIQIELHNRVGERFFVLFNPFKNYADVRQRYDRPYLRLAQAIVDAEFENTKAMQALFFRGAQIVELTA